MTDICRNIGSGAVICTKPAEHDGDHAAIINGQEIATWSNSEKKVCTCSGCPNEGKSCAFHVGGPRGTWTMIQNGDGSRSLYGADGEPIRSR